MPSEGCQRASHSVKQATKQSNHPASHHVIKRPHEVNQTIEQPAIKRSGSITCQGASHMCHESV
eukprot:6492201-Prymnesium_polylepis.1